LGKKLMKGHLFAPIAWAMLLAGLAAVHSESWGQATGGGAALGTFKVRTLDLFRGNEQIV
jgi:hypothetical protein